MNDVTVYYYIMRTMQHNARQVVEKSCKTKVP